jgi:hypothetical protein
MRAVVAPKDKSVKLVEWPASSMMVLCSEVRHAAIWPLATWWVEDLTFCSWCDLFDRLPL